MVPLVLVQVLVLVGVKEIVVLFLFGFFAVLLHSVDHLAHALGGVQQTEDLFASLFAFFELEGVLEEQLHLGRLSCRQLISKGILLTLNLLLSSWLNLTARAPHLLLQPLEKVSVLFNARDFMVFSTLASLVATRGGGGTATLSPLLALGALSVLRHMVWATLKGLALRALELISAVP